MLVQSGYAAGRVTTPVCSWWCADYFEWKSTAYSTRWCNDKGVVEHRVDESSCKVHCVYVNRNQGNPCNAHVHMSLTGGAAAVCDDGQLVVIALKEQHSHLLARSVEWV